MNLLPTLIGIALLCAQADPCLAGIVVLNDDGAWNWLQDKRTIIAGGELIVGSVAMGQIAPERAGDIDVITCNLKTRRIRRTTLHGFRMMIAKD